MPIPESPATLEVLAPADSTLTVDGKPAGSERSFKFIEFDQNSRVRRLEVAVKYADATEVKRTVDLEPGQRITLPANQPALDSPATVLVDTTVALLGAAFSPDSRSIVTVAENGAIVLWDLMAGRPVRNFDGNSEAVQSVVFSSDGEKLLTASLDSTATLWNVRTGRPIRKFRGHAKGVNAAVVSADGKKVLTGSSDKTAILWDAETGALIRTFSGHTDEVVTVALSPDGKTAVTGSTDKLGIFWNTETGEKTSTIRTNDTVSGVEFSPDGKLVAAANFGNFVDLWDVAAGKLQSTTRRVSLDMNGTAFSIDGRRFFSAGRDATAKVWDTRTRVLLREYNAHGNDVQTVKPSPDGRLLLTASRDGTARLFDLATGLELIALTTSNGGKNWAAVAPDGLFDASDGGRRIIGFRFSSDRPGASIDQFFGAFYRSGLLAQIVGGERPMPSGRLGKNLPPVLKIVAPRMRSTPEGQILVEVEATDKGGGVAAPTLYNNGARIALEPEVRRNGDTARFAFKLNLAPGSNKIRVTATSSDGTWEAIPAEAELDSLRLPDRKGRLFVVAAGIGDYADAKLNLKHAESDARALAELLQRRSAGLFDRVDVIPLLGKNATRARLRDTLLDVGGLSQPQDSIVVIVSGRGSLVGDHLFMAPPELRPGAAGVEHDLRDQALDGDELAALLGTAGALNRGLILDATEAAPSAAGGKPRGFALRAAVERWSRTQGVYAIAACAPLPATPANAAPRGLLAGLLLEAGSAGTTSATPRDSNGAASVTDWFNTATQRAAPLLEHLGLNSEVMQQSTKPKGFLLLAATK